MPHCNPKLDPIDTHVEEAIFKRGISVNSSIHGSEGYAGSHHASEQLENLVILRLAMEFRTHAAPDQIAVPHAGLEVNRPFRPPHISERSGYPAGLLYHPRNSELLKPFAQRPPRDRSRIL